MAYFVLMCRSETTHSLTHSLCACVVCEWSGDAKGCKLSSLAVHHHHHLCLLSAPARQLLLLLLLVKSVCASQTPMTTTSCGSGRVKQFYKCFSAVDGIDFTAIGHTVSCWKCFVCNYVWNNVSLHMFTCTIRHLRNIFADVLRFTWNLFCV